MGLTNTSLLCSTGSECGSRVTWSGYMRNGDGRMRSESTDQLPAVGAWCGTALGRAAVGMAISSTRSTALEQHQIILLTGSTVRTAPVSGQSMPRHDAVRSAGYLRFRVMPPVDDGHGSYRIVGKLFRVKAWEGDFSYERHPSGWNSEDLHLRTDGWRTSGGFLVSRIDDVTCRVTHYEDDRLPDQMWRWLLLLRASRSSNPNSSMLRMTASTSWLLCGRTPVPLRRTPPVGPHDLPSADGSFSAPAIHNGHRHALCSVRLWMFRSRGNVPSAGFAQRSVSALVNECARTPDQVKFGHGCFVSFGLDRLLVAGGGSQLGGAGRSRSSPAGGADRGAGRAGRA